MDRRRVFYLRIAAILLVMLLVLPVSVALNYKVENILEGKIGETNSASTYNETEQIEHYLENLSKMETAFISLNENLVQLNTSIEYMGDMMEVVSSILGEPDSKKDVIGCTGFVSKCLVNTQFDDFSNNTLVILSRSYYRQTIFRFFLRFLSLAVRRKLMCTISGVNYIPPVGFLFPREFARGMTPLAFLIYWFSTCFYYFSQHYCTSCPYCIPATI